MYFPSSTEKFYKIASTRPQTFFALSSSKTKSNRKVNLSLKSNAHFMYFCKRFSLKRIFKLNSKYQSWKVEIFSHATRRRDSYNVFTMEWKYGVLSSNREWGTFKI